MEEKILRKASKKASIMGTVSYLDSGKNFALENNEISGSSPSSDEFAQKKPRLWERESFEEEIEKLKILLFLQNLL